MGIIEISKRDIQLIYQQAEASYPEECCGLILGIIKDNYKIAQEIWQTENSWSLDNQDSLSAIDIVNNDQILSKRNRFQIAPKVMLEAQKSARDRNLNIIGIYHSHPDYPATPSEFDRAIAWEQYSYLIASVAQSQVVDFKSWILDENRQFQLEKLIISP